MQLLDRLGQGRSDPGKLLESAGCDDLAKRHGQSHQALSRSRIGAGFVRILASQREPLPDLDEKLRDSGGLQKRHQVRFSIGSFRVTHVGFVR
jgi:hypothetical protein